MVLPFIIVCLLAYMNDFHYGMPTDYYKKVNEIIPFIKYLIRTKVVLHWETMNNKVMHPEIK
jgi:hypothetical protein